MSEVFSSQQLEPVESVWQRARNNVQQAFNKSKHKLYTNVHKCPSATNPCASCVKGTSSWASRWERGIESLRLSSFFPSSVKMDIHTLVEKSHGSELFLDISSEILLLSIRCSLHKRRYVVTWMFHMFSLQLEHMMYPRCIKI